MFAPSLRKHPFLLALRHWGRFARRNLRAKRDYVLQQEQTLSLMWLGVFPIYLKENVLFKVDKILMQEKTSKD